MPRSPVLEAFADGFVEHYESLRNLSRGDGPRLVVPDVYHADAETEVRRAYRLVDSASRKWGRWGLERWRGEKFDQARADIDNVPEVVDHDTARDAEGWLAAAAALLDGAARRLLLAARRSALAASEIDPGPPAPNEVEAAINAARAGGERLAAAAVATVDPEAGINEAQATLESLR